MPVSTILSSRTARLTRQQIADFMLVEDQAIRRAMARRDFVAAETHQRELDRLSAQYEEAA